MNQSRYSKKVVIAAIVAIIAFTISEIILLFFANEGYPDTFVRCWFTFWSVELAALAGIKIAKTATGANNNNVEFPSDDDIEG